jgi:hypothetical protein
MGFPNAGKVTVNGQKLKCGSRGPPTDCIFP